VRTVFIDCRFCNNTASRFGGAIYHFMSHTGASLELHRCTLLDNYASQPGGTIYAKQTAANQPTSNLEMLVSDYGLMTASPRYLCSPVYAGANGYARVREYGAYILYSSM
jgi:hypothetical protein